MCYPAPYSDLLLGTGAVMDSETGLEKSEDKHAECSGINVMVGQTDLYDGLRWDG